jgi:hypothetical protein
MQRDVLMPYTPANATFPKRLALLSACCLLALQSVGVEQSVPLTKPVIRWALGVSNSRDLKRRRQPRGITVGADGATDADIATPIIPERY